MFRKYDPKKIALVAVLFFVVIFLIYFFYFPQSELAVERNKLRNYFAGDFDISEFKPSEDGSLREWWDYDGVRKAIYSMKGDDRLSSPEYIEKFRETLELFERKFGEECQEEHPGECYPFNKLFPYFSAKWYDSWINNKSTEEFCQEMDNNPEYVNILNYWKDLYDRKKELSEEELLDIAAIIGMLDTCEKLSAEDYEAWLGRVLEIEIDESQPIAERMSSINRKIGLVDFLQPLNPKNPNPKSEIIKNAICELPDFEEIKTAGDVCTTLEYYFAKEKCFGSPSIETEEDKALVIKHLKERYFNAKRINCQIGLYNLSGTQR